jgi:hypothetical protein
MPKAIAAGRSLMAQWLERFAGDVTADGALISR